MLIAAILIGLLYALPNLYGEDPAVQITGARGTAANEQTLDQVRSLLDKENIEAKSIALENGAILARFGNPDIQLRAREVLLPALGDQFIVALNLAPATPKWLEAIGGEPMKLGLDLRGGVHFLMEVDMETALGKLQEQNVESLRTLLRDEGIPYSSIRKTDNYGVEIRFRNSDDRSKASDYLARRNQDLIFRDGANNSLRAIFTDERLRDARTYAVQQNITILRNRVNQLGGC
ncbi:preprotein translocase subunit SecD [Proteus penneri ATCC 35198]|nr:preprotein translocase subunit SecD [Proteus penneri ATCC 35198]